MLRRVGVHRQLRDVLVPRVVGRKDLQRLEDGVGLGRVEHHGRRDLRHRWAHALAAADGRGAARPRAARGPRRGGRVWSGACRPPFQRSRRRRRRPSRTPSHGRDSVDSSPASAAARQTGAPGAKPDVTWTSYVAPRLEAGQEQRARLHVGERGLASATDRSRRGRPRRPRSPPRRGRGPRSAATRRERASPRSPISSTCRKTSSFDGVRR